MANREVRAQCAPFRQVQHPTPAGAVHSCSEDGRTRLKKRTRLFQFSGPGAPVAAGFFLALSQNEEYQDSAIFMKQNAPKPPAKAREYPEKTQGSELAARIRQAANKMTEREREEHFRAGMQIIYRASAKKTVRSGH